MVKKLLKHEFAYYFRSFGLFLPIVLVIGIMARVFRLFDNGETINDIIIGSSAVMLWISCCALLLMSWAVGVIRFYKHLFSSEGYLTLTLPVTNAEHIFVKLLASLVFQAACFVVVGLAGMIYTAGEELGAIWKNAVQAWNVLVEGIGAGHIIGYALEMVIMMVVAAVAGMLQYYVCIAIGQTAKKNRILMAIVAYFVMYIITQVVTTILMVILMVMGVAGAFDGMAQWIADNPLASVHIYFCVITLITAGLGWLFWHITHKIMNEKLNLE